jgi:hypothetical protein
MMWIDLVNMRTTWIPTIEVEELEFSETITMDSDWYYDGHGFVPYGSKDCLPSRQPEALA